MADVGKGISVKPQQIVITALLFLCAFTVGCVQKTANAVIRSDKSQRFREPRTPKKK